MQGLYHSQWMIRLCRAHHLNKHKSLWWPVGNLVCRQSVFLRSELFFRWSAIRDFVGVKQFVEFRASSFTQKKKKLCLLLTWMFDFLHAKAKVSWKQQCGRQDVELADGHKLRSAAFFVGRTHRIQRPGRCFIRLTEKHGTKKHTARGGNSTKRKSKYRQ